MINLYESAIVKLYEEGKTINDIENVSWIFDQESAYTIINWETFSEAAKRINYDLNCPIQVTHPSLRINLKDGDCLYRTHLNGVECWDIAKRENSFVQEDTIDITDILNSDLNKYKSHCNFDVEE